jgi:hypothetical protein
MPNAEELRDIGALTCIFTENIYPENTHMTQITLSPERIRKLTLRINSFTHERHLPIVTER